MATLFERTDRKVIPNWRRFDRTSNSGELDNFLISKEKTLISKQDVMEDYIQDWKNNKDLYHAGDLLSACAIHGFLKNDDVINAAYYVLENNKSTYSQTNLAKNVLNIADDISLSTKISTIDDFVINSNREIIYDQINKLKRIISDFPHDFINYVELSRLYSIIGNKDKSIQKIKLALFLSNNNRYVLRSASRLFAHYQELDIAHSILRKNTLIKIDPWIVAAEIGISTLLGKTSNHIKRGIDMIKSNQFTNLSITELASSIGTLELINGSSKNSRNLFNKSLLEPNSNSLAQVEWASENGHFMKVDVDRDDVKFNYEAMAFDLLKKGEWMSAVENTEKWFLDMPFTRRPIFLGNHIAIHYLDDQRLAIKFCHAGLVAHPHDFVLKNNLAYSLALLNRTDEAQKYLNEAKINTDEINKLCMTATQGLILFRKGYHDAGRTYYREAIAKATNIKHPLLISLSILNYAREEILAKSMYVEVAMELVRKVSENPNHPEIGFTKLKVMNMYEIYKAKNTINK